MTSSVPSCVYAIAVMLVANAAISTARAADDADALRGYMLGASCLNCHGDGGPDGNGIPSLTGYTAEAIATAMRQFRDGERGATVMARLARGYSDDEIAQLAAWLAARESP